MMARTCDIRRRRMIVALGGVACVLLLTGVGGEPASSSAAADPQGGEVVVVATEGDTLWNLALPHAPEGADPHAWLAEVAEHNDLDARALRPGAPVRIPQP